ncbi:hypothetical protein CUMW_111940, partial [Citrus unshiu]
MKKKIKPLKPSKRSRRRLLKKVVDYLKYDSYMFAPLVNSRSHQKIKFSSATGLELKERIKANNKKLLEKIVDYMKSDSYLYASMLDSQPMVSSCKVKINLNMAIVLKGIKSMKRMYSVFQKGQHVNLKKNSDYGDQQTDYSVSKCGDRGQTLRWQYSRSTNLSSEGNGKEYDLFKLPLLISI